jgi:small subunit ribosomal protein S16
VKIICRQVHDVIQEETPAVLKNDCGKTTKILPNPDLQSNWTAASLTAHFGTILEAVWTASGNRKTIKRTIMSVKIRMKRVGAKNAPVFRIVVADVRSPRDGKFIEELGTYQPLKKGENFKVDLERAKYWLSKGAQPSDTVASFIKKASKAASSGAPASVVA